MSIMSSSVVEIIDYVRHLSLAADRGIQNDRHARSLSLPAYRKPKLMYELSGNV
jgi:hypothetical protein